MSEIEQPNASADLLDQVAEIVSAYVANNALAATDLPRLIAETYQALLTVSKGAIEQETNELIPAVSIKKSITPEFIICLDDGKKFKSLKRHLKILGMTPDEYRTKWGLPASYPMTAPNYSAARSSLAKASGLGRKPAAAPVVPAKRTRKPKVDA